jgi:hypothetical protein
MEALHVPAPLVGGAVGRSRWPCNLQPRSQGCLYYCSTGILSETWLFFWVLFAPAHRRQHESVSLALFGTYEVKAWRTVPSTLH